MYDNNQSEIRSGFVNFLGALLKASKYEGNKARHEVSAIAIEEVIKMCSDEKNVVDMFSIKPLLKGAVYVLKQRMDIIDKSDEIPKSIKEIYSEDVGNTVKTINNILSNVKEE